MAIAMDCATLSAPTRARVQVLERFDHDRSGRLDLVEFHRLVGELQRFQAGVASSAAAPSVTAATAAAASPLDDPEAAFRRYDADGSGDIDVAELRACLSELQMPVNTLEARDVLSKFDNDQSGRLDRAEFLRLVSELRGFKEARAEGRLGD